MCRPILYFQTTGTNTAFKNTRTPHPQGHKTAIGQGWSCSRYIFFSFNIFRLLLLGNTYNTWSQNANSTKRFTVESQSLSTPAPFPSRYATSIRVYSSQELFARGVRMDSSQLPQAARRCQVHAKGAGRGGVPGLPPSAEKRPGSVPSAGSGLPSAPSGISAWDRSPPPLRLFKDPFKATS